MKVALVYDRVNKWGGAEQVLLCLHELFPDAPLFTSVYHPKKASWAKVFTVKPSFLQHIPFVSSYHEYIPFLMPFAFESFSFDEYDLVISVTSESAKGIKTNGKTKHLCYCLTPTRYLWSGYDDYFSQPLFRMLTKPLVSLLRTWDVQASKRPDAYIAISDDVKKRIKTYYKKNAVVVYPPVALADTAKVAQNTQDKGYFLIVSRLVPYKRIDLAIQACETLGIPLKIIGSGSEKEYLKRFAKQYTQFLGHLTNESVVRYYKHCKAFLFPGKEDFGIAALEAQACGKPVIAFYAGGAKETVLGDKTGIFFHEQTVDAVIDAIKRFEKRKFSPDLCVSQAKKFSKARFKKSFLQQVKFFLKA